MKISFTIMLLLIAYYYYRGKHKEETIKREYYHEVKAVINSVYQSGRNYKQTTLLNVSYTHAGQQKRIILRREGYKEGVYKKGDTITVYINPGNPQELK